MVFFNYENALFKVSKLNVYQCGGGVSDLLGEDWVTWENEDQLEESNVYHCYWKHNTTLMDSILKIRHPMWWLWDEKTCYKTYISDYLVIILIFLLWWI